jgi:hypothetical protein
MKIKIFFPLFLMLLNIANDNDSTQRKETLKNVYLWSNIWIHSDTGNNSSRFHEIKYTNLCCNKGASSITSNYDGLILTLSKSSSYIEIAANSLQRFLMLNHLWSIIRNDKINKICICYSRLFIDYKTNKTSWPIQI